MFKGYFINKNSTCKYPHCYVKMVQPVITNTDTIWGCYNPLKEKDVIWGCYLPIKEANVIWGTYDGGGTVTHNITAADCTNIDNYFMIENTWHKIPGSYAGNLQSALYDANNQKMDNPDFIIDIYYKLICARPDNWANAVQLLNPSSDRIDLSIFANYGFTPSFKYDNVGIRYSGAYIENPTTPFDLPSDSILKDGYTSVQFPTGMYFDTLPNEAWDGYGPGNNSNLNSDFKFIHVAGRQSSNSMMPTCDQFVQGTITYAVDPSVGAMGFPFSAPYNTRYMPRLFTGMLGAHTWKKLPGVLYICLGVHHR